METITETFRKESEFVKKCKEYAIGCHNNVNQLYDGKPYSFHLQMAIDFGYMFLWLIPEKDRDDVIGGLWCHDSVEDTRITWNDLRKATNEIVANIAYALTNEKGKTRAERANAKYYRGIRKEKYADYDKICDRMANVKYGYDKYIEALIDGKAVADSMFLKYRKDNDKFTWSIIKPEWYELHQHIFHLFIGHKNYFKLRKSKHRYSIMITHLENMFKAK